MFPIQFVSFLRMVVIHAILLIIFLFGSSFAQSNTAESSNSLQAEVMVEIQYNNEVGSGIILMTSYPVSCTTSVTSNSSTISSSTSTILVVSSLSTMPIWTSSTLSTLFNTLPIFGTSRTQMINTSCASQYLLQMTTGASQIMTSIIATQNLSESSTSISRTSLVTGLGIRFHDPWSHIFIWAAVTEIVSGFL